MNNQVKKIGIIMVNYKDYCDRFLVDARDSLRQLDYPKNLYTVYIIDNVSTTLTLNRLHEMYPEAVIIPTSGNGWGHANNLGMKAAWQDGCDAAALVNMDTVFDGAWLTELVAAAYADESIGITQAKIMLWDEHSEKRNINSIGNKFHFLGFSFCDGYNEEDAVIPKSSGIHQEGNHTRSFDKLRMTAVTDIYSASGASMLIKKEVAQKIGECDEEYFMYHDDLELSLKARIAGYRIVLAPQSIMYHKYEFGRSIRQVYYMERNRYLTLFTFLKWKTIILITPAIIIMDIGMWLYAVTGKWADTKWRVKKYFLKKSTWNHIFKQRKKIHALRTISDRQLLQGVTGKVEFQEIDNMLLKYIGNPILNAYWILAKNMIIW